MKIICTHDKFGWKIEIDRGDEIPWRPIEMVKVEKVAPIVDNLAMAYELGFNYPHYSGDPEEKP